MSRLSSLAAPVALIFILTLLPASAQTPRGLAPEGTVTSSGPQYSVLETLSAYTYEPNGGHRKVVNYADQPCRINTYGNSYTQCAQVSDGETWQETLAAHFREPIRNFGVGGYGVYQAYRRAMRVEATDLAADHIILNIWDDDHLRNIDSARWHRVAWGRRELPRGGGEDTYPVHGFPWAHLRYDLERGAFVELPGFLEREEDLRRLTDAEFYYESFKDDEVVQLSTLCEGGDAPVERLEQLAEALGLEVDLRDESRRVEDARRLHQTYGLRSTECILDQLTAWAGKNDRRLMVLLSYDVPAVKTFIETGERFDTSLLDYLREHEILHADCLQKAADEYRDYSLSVDEFLARFYVARAGAQVFGHYSPHGAFWFAHAIRQELVDWLDPKPPAYC